MPATTLQATADSRTYGRDDTPPGLAEYRPQMGTVTTHPAALPRASDWAASLSLASRLSSRALWLLGRIWRTPRAQDRTADRLAETDHRDVRTIRRGLAELAAAGQVVYGDRAWHLPPGRPCQPTDVDPADVWGAVSADDLDTLDRHAARRLLAALIVLRYRGAMHSRSRADTTAAYVATCLGIGHNTARDHIQALVRLGLSDPHPGTNQHTPRPPADSQGGQNSVALRTEFGSPTDRIRQGCGQNSVAKGPQDHRTTDDHRAAKPRNDQLTLNLDSQQPRPRPRPQPPRDHEQLALTLPPTVVPATEPDDTQPHLCETCHRVMTTDDQCHHCAAEANADRLNAIVLSMAAGMRL